MSSTNAVLENWPQLCNIFLKSTLKKVLLHLIFMPEWLSLLSKVRKDKRVLTLKFFLDNKRAGPKTLR